MHPRARGAEPCIVCLLVAYTKASLLHTTASQQIQHQQLAPAFCHRLPASSCCFAYPALQVLVFVAFRHHACILHCTSNTPKQHCLSFKSLDSMPDETSPAHCTTHVHVAKRHLPASRAAAS